MTLGCYQDYLKVPLIQEEHTEYPFSNEREKLIKCRICSCGCACDLYSGVCTDYMHTYTHSVLQVKFDVESPSTQIES